MQLHPLRLGTVRTGPPAARRRGADHQRRRARRRAVRSGEPFGSGHANDHRTARESTLKLRHLVRAEGTVLTIHSHAAEQWRTLVDVYR